MNGFGPEAKGKKVAKGFGYWPGPSGVGRSVSFGLDVQKGANIYASRGAASRGESAEAVSRAATAPPDKGYASVVKLMTEGPSGGSALTKTGQRRLRRTR